MLNLTINLIAPAICFTTDMWQDKCKSHSWLGLTLHWVDENWNMKMNALECIHFKSLMERVVDSNQSDSGIFCVDSLNFMQILKI